MSFAGKFLGATTPAQRKARKSKAASHSKPKQRAVLKDARGAHRTKRAEVTASGKGYKTRGGSDHLSRTAHAASGKARKQQRRVKGTGR